MDALQKVRSSGGSCHVSPIPHEMWHAQCSVVAGVESDEELSVHKSYVISFQFLVCPLR